MGTSLSGLTPATTFDGLLKTSDNEPLDGTLKAISTGDGTDTILQLSNSALTIGGATTIVSDNTGNDNAFEINTSTSSLLKVFNANSTTTPVLSIGHGSQDTRFTMFSTIGFRAQGINIAEMTSSEVRVGGGSGARLAVKGSGATSATTSLLVQNSAGGSVFSVRDDGALLFHRSSNSAELLRIDDTGSNPRLVSGNNVGKSLTLGNDTLLSAYSSIQFKTHDGSAYSEAMRITGANDQFVGIGETTPTSRLHIKGSGNDNTTTSLLVQNSDAENIMAITDDGYLTYRTPQRELLTLGNGSVLKYGTNSSFSALYNRASIYDGTNTTQFENGNVGIGNGTTTPTARLQVKGSGATSATTALLVQNSDTSTSLTYDDSGELFLTGSKTQITLQRDGGNGGVIGNNNGRTYFGNSSALVYLGGKIGINQQTPTAQLQVKGSGATSATTALLVQNSAGTEHLKVTDDGSVNIRQNLYVNHASVSSRALRLGWGSIYATDNNSELTIGAVYSQNTAPRIILGGKNRSGGADAVLVQTLNGMYIAPTASTQDPDAQLHVKGSGNDDTTTALLVQNSDGTDIINVSDNGIIGLNPSDNGAKWELNAANNYILSNVYAHYYDTAGTVNYRNASVTMGVGASAASGTRMLIKGSGASSGTTALLVENSAGTELLKVEDGGDLKVNGNGILSTGNIAMSFYKYIRSGSSFLYLKNTSNNIEFHQENDIDFRSGYNGSVVAKITNDGAFVAGASSLDASAVLQADSTTKGFLPPRMTTTERDAISTPAAGLMVYNTTTNKAQCYNGTTWNDLF